MYVPSLNIVDCEVKRLYSPQHPPPPARFGCSCATAAGKVPGMADGALLQVIIFRRCSSQTAVSNSTSLLFMHYWKESNRTKSKYWSLFIVLYQLSDITLKLKWYHLISKWLHLDIQGDITLFVRDIIESCVVMSLKDCQFIKYGNLGISKKSASRNDIQPQVWRSKWD